MCGRMFGRRGAYEEDGSVKDFWSKPHSQTLYAMNTARPADSMMLVRRTTRPIMLRKRKAVIATPRRVDDKGEDAAVG